MPQLTIIATLVAKPGKSESLGQALLALVPPSRAEEGCINYDLHQSLDDANTWVVYENWVSKAALEYHFTTPHFQAFSQQLGDLTDGSVGLQELKA
ncbi:MAG: antibiotic biosynthesis monooxygenase [Acidobacteria bacterium]|nr:antibiotic biosynthesis monooxygenase [Acidobacteriota bacterium]